MRENLELPVQACAAGQTADGVQVPRLPRVGSLEHAMLRAAWDVVRCTPSVEETWHAFLLRRSQDMPMHEVSSCMLS